MSQLRGISRPRGDTIEDESIESKDIKNGAIMDEDVNEKANIHDSKLNLTETISKITNRNWLGW